MTVRDEFFMITDNLIEITGLKDRTTGDYEPGATIVMSLFKQATLNIDISRLVFTSGGVGTPVVGETILGATDGAWAKIASITLTGGTWAGGDAAGWFTLTGQHGTFKAAGENLDIIDGQANIATIASNSTGAESANAGGKTKLTVTDHGLTDYETDIRIESSQAYDAEHTISAFEKNTITIDTAYTAEKFKGTEKIYVGIPNGHDISIAFVAASDGVYQGILPDNLKGIVLGGVYYLFVSISKAANKVKMYRLEWTAVYPDKRD